jgi:phage regulator Rha-like protein
MEFELTQKDIKESIADYLVKRLFVKKPKIEATSPINAKDIEHLSFNKNKDGFSIIVKLLQGKH